MLFNSLNRCVLKLVSSRDTQDTSKVGNEWKPNGKMTKWTKLYFVDDMGAEYTANVKGIDEATLYQDMEGKEGILQLKVEQYGRELRVRFFAFDITS